MTASALYAGEVMHRRLRGVSHVLRYRIFMLLLDLDELDGLKLKRLKRGRSGLISFDARDHGDGSDTALRVQVDALLTDAGLATGGAIRLLCMPRILGYGFNPISVYFCHGPDGSLAAILYEVSNTFGDRHSYLIACDPGDQSVISQTADKTLHVSPFMDMDLTYRFTVQPPGEAVQIAVGVSGSDGPILDTAFTGKRAPLTDAALLAAWASHPLLTFKVIAAIHWEALKLWLKGAGYRHRPPAPAHPVSLGSTCPPRRSSISAPSRAAGNPQHA